MSTPIVSKQMMPDLGLSEEAMKSAAELLAKVLADEFVLRLKLRNYHWNVTGPQFRSLHELFEEQYEELADIVDETAERLRTYGRFAPGTMQEYSKLTRLEEQPGDHPSADEMVMNLVLDHEMMVRNLTADSQIAVDENEDVGLEDYFIGLLQQHQEMAWMLRSFLIRQQS